MTNSRGWAALAIGASACATGNLTFTRDQSVIAQVTVPTGASYVVPGPNIAAALATCLDDLTVALQTTALAATRITGAPRTELQLFARAPGEMASFLSKLRRGDIEPALARTDPDQRAHGLWHPQAATPAGFPNTLVVTWPATPGTTGAASTLALTSSAFWGPHFATGLAADLDLCHPKGDPGLLQPGGTLHEVIVHNRGTCRREVGLGDLLGSGNQLLVDAVHSRRAPGVGNHHVRYSILQSALDHPGTALDPPLAQLFLFLLFDATDLLGNATSTIGGSVRYDFELVDGRVVLSPHELDWSYSGVWGPETSEGVPGVPGWHHAVTSKDGEMVKQLNATILDQQLLGVQSPLFGAQLTSFACDAKTFTQQCGAAADTVAGTLAPLIRARTTGAAATFTAGEVDHLLCAIGDAASCARLGRDRNAVLASRWTCGPSKISATPYCDLIIPVARLVASPDSLGAVFFDQDALDNAAYALEAASAGALCAPDTQPPAQRGFAASVLLDPGRR